MIWLALAVLGALGVGAALLMPAPPSAVEPKGRTMTNKRKILFLGDSLTAGGYWRKVALPDVSVEGRGWPGKQVAAVLRNAAPLLAEYAPTDVVLLAGVNDLASGHGAARVEADLTAAWQALRARGARVWAVQLTPWAGYRLFQDPARAARLRAATAAVNAYMTARRGQDDGPDRVIDAALLGDGDGKLRRELSRDGLHVNDKGQAALAALVTAALAAEPAAAQVGAAAPPALLEVVKQFTERLKLNDLEPVKAEVVDAHHVTFWFWTEFRAQRAAEVLPQTYKYGAQMLYVKTAVLDAGAEVGEVRGTPQSTPWTCGPAALRAVLAHHGTDVGEDELALLAGNVPVLGVRPTGLVKAATALGYRVDVVQLGGVAALAPYLARGLPVMVVVDSWTQPGKASHWVVVTGVGPDWVEVMDPHAPGLWRDLKPTELDARWWHREPGGKVARRLALVVMPDGEDA